MLHCFFTISYGSFAGGSSKQFVFYRKSGAIRMWQWMASVWHSPRHNFAIYHIIRLIVAAAFFMSHNAVQLPFLWVPGWIGKKKAIVSEWTLWMINGVRIGVMCLCICQNYFCDTSHCQNPELSSNSNNFDHTSFYGSKTAMSGATSPLYYIDAVIR